MTDQHPITPPPELVEQWRYAASNVPASFCTDPGGRRDYIDYIATQAARWGADQELEACCDYMQREDFHGFAKELLAARRPKPPILAEQALVACERSAFGIPGDRDTIRRALERLKELENHQ